MRHSSLLLAFGSLYAASVSAQSCASQYSTIAGWIKDFQPAQRWCSARHAAPTTTVVVAQTTRPRQQRSLATYVFANVEIPSKPRPDEARGSSHHHKRQRPSASRAQFYYDLMNKQSRSAWVQGVCGCMAQPVTRTSTRPARSSATRRPIARAAEDQSDCEDGPYAGTGACQCEYEVQCGFTGVCGDVDATRVTSTGSWQECGETCDNDSDCSAWVYSYATNLCTEITDLDCGGDGFQTVEDPDSMLGFYTGGCTGVCLT